MTSEERDQLVRRLEEQVDELDKLLFEGLLREALEIKIEAQKLLDGILPERETTEKRPLRNDDRNFECLRDCNDALIRRRDRLVRALDFLSERNLTVPRSLLLGSNGPLVAEEMEETRPRRRISRV